MELLKARHGFRLQIGGHEMFMTEYDLRQLAQLLDEQGFKPAGADARRTANDAEETTAPVYVQMLKDIERGERKFVRVPLEKVQTMYWQVHTFNRSYGRHITCKVRKRRDGTDAESKSYVLERFF